MLQEKNNLHSIFLNVLLYSGNNTFSVLLLVLFNLIIKIEK